VSLFDIDKINSVFQKPKGYKTTHIFGTSYSLSGEVLNDLIKQTSIHKTIDYLNDEHIFIACQNNRYIGGLDNDYHYPLARLLLVNNCIYAVEQNHSFHPKVWIIRYEENSARKRILYRIAVLSRNISKQNMLEGGIVLEGHKTEASCEKESKEGLIAFLSKFDDENRVVSLLKNELPYVSFLDTAKMIGGDLAEYAFLPTEGNKFISDFAKSIRQARKIFAVSPFLGEAQYIQNLLMNKLDYTTIITRKGENTREFIEKNIALYYLSEDSKADNNNETEKEPDDAGQREYLFDNDELPLHAKIYAVDLGDLHCLYVGSANMSKNGFEVNTEMMVKITSNTINFAEVLENVEVFKTSRVRIDKVYDGLKEDYIELDAISDIRYDTESKDRLISNIKGGLVKDQQTEIINLFAKSKPKRKSVQPDSKGDDGDEQENASSNLKVEEKILTILMKKLMRLTDDELETVRQNLQDYDFDVLEENKAVWDELTEVLGVKRI